MGRIIKTEEFSESVKPNAFEDISCECMMWALYLPDCKRDRGYTRWCSTA
jgi:hypothetical protein